VSVFAYSILTISLVTKNIFNGYSYPILSYELNNHDNDILTADSSMSICNIKLTINLFL